MIFHQTRLTDAVVRKLKPPETGNAIHWDAAVRGFGIRLTAKGARSFIFNYRVKGSGRERRYTIGSFGDWTTAGARDKAKQLRRLVDDGGDPLGDVESEREAPTVADLIERFTTEHLPRRRPGTVKGYRQMLNRHIRPALQHLKVDEVSYSDIDRLHRRITKDGGPYVANRTVAVVSKMFSLAIKWKMRTDNPAHGVEFNTEDKRKRYLSDGELARLTAALAKHPDQQAANIVRALLMTGARSSEVFGLRWDQLNFETGIWTKPASTTKQKASHSVPLSAPVLQLLSDIERKGEWVFPGERGLDHVVTIRKSWPAICKAANISGLRVHDLRHSFASQLASGGASLPLIGALLGHSNPVTTSRYMHLFQDPQRQAVERVGAIVTAAADQSQGATVESFPKSGRHGR